MMIGIIKSKTLASGAVGEFWKISKINVDLLAGTAQVTLSLYINVASFQAGKSPLSMSKVYNLTLSNSDIAAGDLRDMIWTKIKAKAATVIDIDISGQSISPRSYDPDLVGGTDVIV